MRPWVRSIVCAEVAGVVSEMPVDVGDRAARVGLLCRLRDVTRRATLDEASASLSRLEAMAREADAMRRKWEFEKARMQRLREAGSGSEKELEDTLRECEASAARHDAAVLAVTAQRAIVERAADDLARTEIRAPFDGFVVSRRTEIGQWVMEGGEVVELVALDPVRVQVHAPEAAVAYCAPGESVSVHFDALNEAMTGRLGRVSPDGDERARTFPVEIDLPNPEGRLRAGMFARAEVPAGPRRDCTVVPKDAVLRRESNTQVFVVRKDEHGATAVPLPVAVLLELADHVAVESPGLNAGDAVVVRGNERMVGPTPVMLPPPTSQTASGRRDAGGTGSRE